MPLTTLVWYTRLTANGSMVFLMVGVNCTTQTAVSTMALSSKVFPVVRAGSLVPKDGTTKASSSRNRPKGKERSLMRILAIVMLANGREICLMARARRPGPNLGKYQHTKDNTWAERSTAKECIDVEMSGSIRESFLKTSSLRLEAS